MSHGLEYAEDERFSGRSGAVSKPHLFNSVRYVYNVLLPNLRKARLRLETKPVRGSTFSINISSRWGNQRAFFIFEISLN